MKVDRWGWQPDNRLLSVASVTASFIPMYPMYPLLLHPSSPHKASIPLCFYLHHVFANYSSPIYLFSHFAASSIICPPYLSLPPPFFTQSPSPYSFTLCHYGPTLTEAFIKCQLYTGDHTAEAQDTMISDPQRSTCLWAFSSEQSVNSELFAFVFLQVKLEKQHNMCKTFLTGQRCHPYSIMEEDVDVGAPTPRRGVNSHSLPICERAWE